MFRIGIDVGSTYVKYCVMDCRNGNLKLWSEKSPIKQKDFFDKKIKELNELFPNCEIVSCGYGRKNVDSVKYISELSALAIGANYISPENNVVLDIGGQDTKIIYQENGILKEFFINEKCAAGSGLFLNQVCQLLNVKFSEIKLTNPETAISISSKCAVFAQSEIVELIAANVPEDDIINAVLKQIFIQAKSLLGKVRKSSVLLSGGLTLIDGIKSFAESTLKTKCDLKPFCSFISSIGCALSI